MWLEEIYDPKAPKLDFAYIEKMMTIKLTAEWLMIYSNCMNLNKYNMFLLGLMHVTYLESRPASYGMPKLYLSLHTLSSWK